MKTSKQLEEKFTILNGRVHLFRRPTSSYWWAGFHFKGKYVRTSTKESDSRVAERIAEKWYIEKQAEIASGKFASPKKVFEKIVPIALADFEARVERGERSASTFKSVKKALEGKVKPFFSKIPIDQVNVQTWFKFKEHIYEQNPKIKRGTFHQYKNALRLVLNKAYAMGLIERVPEIKDQYSEKRIDAPRPWFSRSEYKTLLAGVRRHIKFLEKAQPRWIPAAEELYDYIIWGTNTGCRVSEMSNIRFCDVELKKDGPLVLNKDGKRERLNYLIIRNIKGKRGTGVCRSFYGAAEAWKRILKRRNIKDPRKSTQKIFVEHHRDMFNQILRDNNLKFTATQPPVKRDFVSLRATYISFRLLNGASVYEVANNCRTSVAMIENSYAKYLGGEVLEGVNKIDGKLEAWSQTELEREVDQDTEIDVKKPRIRQFKLVK
jgi:integrase